MNQPAAWTVTRDDMVLRIEAAGGGFVLFAAEKHKVQKILDDYNGDEAFAEHRPSDEDGWLLRIQKDHVLASYFLEMMGMEAGFAVEKPGSGDELVACLQEIVDGWHDDEAED